MYQLSLLIILIVAAIDQYCLVKYVTYDEELNPVGKLLIHHGGKELFSAVKLFGTCLVVWALVHFKEDNKVKTAISVIAMLQLLLIYVMFFA